MSDVLVLCYHAVSERWDAALSILPERLDSQLRWLVSRGYRGATFTQAVTAPPAPRTVAVTFDDAYRSVLELGLPVLERHGLPGTVFAPTDHVGTERPMAWPGIDHWLGGPFEGELVAMNWAELNALAERGWEVGSHTCSHPRLTTLGDDALREELERSREACAQGMGRVCDSIAYPYGDVDPRVVAAARAAGYRTAAALPERFGRARALEWPRVGVYFEDSDERFRRQASPLVRRLRATPLWDGALAAYRLARRVRPG